MEKDFCATVNNKVFMKERLHSIEKPCRPLGAVLIAAAVLVIAAALICGILFGAAPSSEAAVPRSNGIFWLLMRYAWCVLLTGMLGCPLVKGSAQKKFGYFRAIRFGMVLQNIFLIVIVVGFAFALKTFLPFLDRSWLYLFPIADGKAINVGILPVYTKYFGLPFVILLSLNLPELAHYEEMQYRRGTKNWRQGMSRSLRFGLAHCFVGIPLYAGFALSLSGLYFTYQYFRGGVDNSTAHHLTYNLLVVFALTATLFMRHTLF